jgi:hypothetical protein
MRPNGAGTISELTHEAIVQQLGAAGGHRASVLPGPTEAAATTSTASPGSSRTRRAGHDACQVVQHVVRRWMMPSSLPAAPRGVHEFRQTLTQLLKRVRREGDFPVQFVGAYRRVEGVFMSPKRYEQLVEAENLVEDIGLAEVLAQRDDGRFHEGTTEDFLAEVEQHTT